MGGRKRPGGKWLAATRARALSRPKREGRSEWDVVTVSRERRPLSLLLPPFHPPPPSLCQIESASTIYDLEQVTSRLDSQVGLPRHNHTNSVVVVVGSRSNT
jgi:hypothetical protein